MQADKQDMAPEAVSVSDHVDRVETMDLCPVNEDLDEAVFTTVDSISLSKIPDGSQDADSGVRDALGDEGRKSGIDVVEASGLTGTNELAVEQIQVFVEGKVAEVDCEDVSKTEDIFSGNDAGDLTLRPEKSQTLGVEAVNGNPDSAVQLAQGHAVEDEELESRTKVVNKESSAVITEPLVERNPDSEVQVTEGHVLEDEKLETRIEAVNPGYSIMITEPPVDDIDNVVAGEITVENKKVSETVSVATDTNALDVTSSGPEKNQGLQAEALGGSTESYEGANLSCYVNTSMQDEKHEIVAEAAEIVSNMVKGNPAKENPIEDDYVIVDSNSLPEVPNGSQASVSCAPSAESADSLLDGNLDSEVEATETHALGGESQKSQTLGVEAVNGNPDSAVQLAQGHAVEDEELESRTKVVNKESSAVITEPLVERNPDSEVQVTEGHVLEDEKLETRIEAVNPGYSIMITEPPVDDIDNVVAGEITVENKKVSETVAVATDTNALDGTSSGPEKNQGSQAEALGGSTESYEGANLSCYVNTSMQDEKHEIVAEAAEIVSNMVKGNPAKENPIEDDYVIVDSNSLPEVPNGSQASVSCAPSAESADSLLDGNLDSEFEATETHALGGESQKSQTLGVEAVNGNPDSAVQLAQGHAVEDEELESRTKVVNKESSAVITEPLVERNPDSEVQVTEGHVLEDEKLETRIEAVNPGYSIMITELPVDDIDNVVAGEITVENKKVSETVAVATDTNALDGTSSGPEKNQGSQAEALGESTESYEGANLSCYVNTSMQDEKHEIVAEAAEIVSNMVKGNPAKENPIEDDYVIVDSNSLPEVPNGSQASVSCAPSAESADSLLDGNLDSEVEATETHALGGESQKSGAVKVGCSELIKEALVEQNQVVGCKVAVVENEEASKTKSASGDLLDGVSSRPEKDQSLEAEAVSHPVEDPIRGPCFTIDSSSVDVVVDGSQFTGEYPDSEVQRHAATPHEDQNMSTHVSEVDAPGVGNQNTEVVAATESAGGSSKVEGSQIMESHLSQVGVSEISVNDCSIGIPDEDLETRDEIVKEQYPPEDSHEEGGEFPEIEGDLEFFELDCLDDVQTDDAMDDGDFGKEKVEIEEQVAGFEQAKSMEQQFANSEALKSEPTVTYHLTPEKEGEFSISDLVWGKVRSHPWWPGQIFNSSDASEQAMKYHKKDNNFLVAYFGDQTFAWNDASAMKPFRTHFSQMEKQNSTESFRVAVNGALDEVRRRAELGMACSCTPEEVYAKLKSQVIENPGIREEAKRTDVLDKNLSGSSFRPDDLVQYIKDLALHPRGGGDRLELAIAQAQLLAFYRLKGHFRLPEFHVYRGLSESDLDISPSRERKKSEEMAELATPFPENEEHAASVEVKRKNQDKTSRKRKHFPEDNLCSSRKERSLSDLMAGKKPDNNGHNHADGESPAPQSFKVGECIRRIASQLTGAPSILKSSSESHQTHEGSHRRGVTFPKEYSHPDEMLLQLCLAARDPMKGYSFLTIIIGFFSDFRDSISLDHPSLRKHKKSEQVGVGNKGTRKSNSKISSAETFDFEDTNDSYWTDRVIQNTSDEQTADKNHDRKEELELGTTPTEKDDICVEPGNSLQLYDSKEQNLDGECDLLLSKSSRKNRKRKEGFRVGTSVEDGDTEKSLHNNDQDLPMKKPRKPRKKQGQCLETPTDKDHDQLNNVDRGHDKNGPTTLLLSFTEPRSIPSETNLNRTFRRFGPLKESETEVMRDTNSARVVFKTRNDAEVALSSAGTFSIFGPVAVSYQLSSFPLTPSQASLFATPQPQGREDAASVEWNTI